MADIARDLADIAKRNRLRKEASFRFWMLTANWHGYKSVRDEASFDRLFHKKTTVSNILAQRQGWIAKMGDAFCNPAQVAR